MRSLAATVLLVTAFALSSAARAETPPAAAWRMDADTGQTAKDSSGNGNDAVLKGASWLALEGRTFLYRLARRIALSCDLKISGRARQKRIARNPMKGFTSSGGLRYDANLSPPRSIVRITTGEGARLRATSS